MKTSGNTILITGGGSGIGLGLSPRHAEANGAYDQVLTMLNSVEI